MNEQILLCTDLDRTLIPNGPQQESPQAREHFHRVCASPRLTLAYVSGRHQALVEEAIAQYALPQPDYVVGDVGTTIYQVEDAQNWRHLSEWEAHIGSDWAGHSHGELAGLFDDLADLQLQEQSKQNRFKLSYYVPLQADRDGLDAEVKLRLQAAGVNATRVWSVDEPAGTGLLDVLPATATKLHAVEFLIQVLGFSLANTVFSGDSGNDMPVLVSPVHAVLVNNAQPEVCEEAISLAQAQHNRDALYLATGGYLGMNGNYSAGILEGLAHYHPQWMEAVLAGATTGS
jgi:sucrose-6F-phosphate phosphohydrolase